MKVRMLVGRAGADFTNNVGDEIEVDAKEAGRMIEAGQCVPVGKQKPERAVKTPPETRGEEV